jgi:phospho-N-acetylmuramoyl-pentapeptide-transferase
VKPFRVYRMTPLHHHFEPVGWAETTIMIRFRLIAVMFVAFGPRIFYIGWFPNSLRARLWMPKTHAPW